VADLVLPLIPIVSIIFDIAVIGVDWYTSSLLNDSASQLEALLNSIQYGSTFDDFISNCWLFIVLGILFFWFCLALAFPKHRRGSVQ